MQILFTSSFMLWLGVLIYMSPSVLSVFRGNMRRGDPPRLCCFGFALVSTLGALRWLLAPDDKMLLASIFTLSICVALFTLIVSKSYGRGDDI